MTLQSSLAVALERTPPPMGGFSITVLRLEVRRLLRNRRTMILAIAMPSHLLPWLRTQQRLCAPNRRAGQPDRIRDDQHRPVRCRIRHRDRRRHGLHRTDTRMEPTTSGHARFHRAAYIVIKMLTSLDPGCGCRRRCLPGRSRHQSGGDADRSVGHHRDLRVDRITPVLRHRAVHRVSASLRERHPDHLARPDGVLLCRRTLHSGQPLPAQLRHLGEVHSPVRAQRTCALPAAWQWLSSGSGCSTSPHGSRFMSWCCLAVSPRHRQSVTLSDHSAWQAEGTAGAAEICQRSPPCSMSSVSRRLGDDDLGLPVITWEHRPRPRPWVPRSGPSA